MTVDLVPGCAFGGLIGAEDALLSEVEVVERSEAPTSPLPHPRWARGGEAQAPLAHHRRNRGRLRAKHGAELPIPHASHSGSDLADDGETRSRRIAWAKLLARVFAIDVHTCSRCTGPMKLLAFVTKPNSLGRLLAYTGLSIEIPPIASARAPPQSAWAFDFV